MPFAIADLVAILGALALLLVAVLIDWAVQHANASVPNTSILGISLFGWLHDWLGDLHNWAVDAEDAANDTIKKMVVDTGWILSRIAGAAMNASKNLLTLVRHVGTTLITDARNDAESFATAADAVVAHVAADAVSDARTLATTLASSLQNNINTVVDTTIPQAVAVAKNDVLGTLAQAETNLQSNIDTVTNDLNTDIGNVMAVVNPLVTAVFTTIPAELVVEALTEKQDVASTAETAQANLVTATQSLQSELNGVQSQLGEQETLLSNAQAAISSLDATSDTYGQDLTTLAQEASSATAAITTLSGKAVSLQSQVTQNQAAITTLQQTQIITLPALPDISIPSSLVVPTAVAGLGYIVADITQEIDRCMVSVCDGPNNISNLLSGILGGLDLIDITTFLKSAIENPGAEIAAFSAEAEGLYTSADGFLDSLLSL